LTYKYRAIIEKSNFIDLLLDTNVLSINGNNEKNGELEKAQYLEVVNNNENSVRHKVYINRLVVACGGIENSRLLLWSQHVNKLLFANLPVGEHWMEHPTFLTGEIIGYTEKVNDFIDEDFLPNRAVQFLQPTDVMIKQNDIDNASIRIQLRRGNTKLKSLIKDILCVAPDYGNKLTSLANYDLVCSLIVGMSWEQKARKSNRIELDHENKDRYGVPKVNLIWKLNQDDKKTALTCMEKLGEMFLDEDLGRVGVLPFLLNNDEFPHDDDIAGNHHMGGTVMSDSQLTGVVDSNLKVFNVSNVWVAGSSVFPAGGAANPTLSIVQLSLRLADHLVKSKL